ncbi:hypothetical protein GGI00_005407, partial [Coemansia sp. RSA 2681]
GSAELGGQGDEPELHAGGREQSGAGAGQRAGAVQNHAGAGGVANSRDCCCSGRRHCAGRGRIRPADDAGAGGQQARARQAAADAPGGAVGAARAHHGHAGSARQPARRGESAGGVRRGQDGAGVVRRGHAGHRHRVDPLLRARAAAARHAQRRRVVRAARRPRGPLRGHAHLRRPAGGAAARIRIKSGQQLRRRHARRRRGARHPRLRVPGRVPGADAGAAARARRHVGGHAGCHRRLVRADGGLARPGAPRRGAAQHRRPPAVRQPHAGRRARADRRRAGAGRRRHLARRQRRRGVRGGAQPGGGAGHRRGAGRLHRPRQRGPGAGAGPALLRLRVCGARHRRAMDAAGLLLPADAGIRGRPRRAANHRAPGGRPGAGRCRCAGAGLRRVGRRQRRAVVRGRAAR